MGDDTLESELDQVTAELVAARIEYASLGARIAGLQARHAALSKAVSGAGQQSRPSASAAAGSRASRCKVGNGSGGARPGCSATGFGAIARAWWAACSPPCPI